MKKNDDDHNHIADNDTGIVQVKEDSFFVSDEASTSQEDSDREEIDERLTNKQRRDAARKYLESLQNSSKILGNLQTSQKDSTLEQHHEILVDAADIDNENIAKRLQQDILEARGKVFRKIAKEYTGLQAKRIRSLKGINSTPTCVAITPDFVLAGFKSGDILQWETASGKLVHTFAHARKVSKASEASGHFGHVLAIAVSPDGKYLVSGGSDKLLIVWNLDKGKLSTVFTSHRGAVTSLAFQLNSMTLFSCSTDRTIKIWNLEQLAYVDTLFGHQDEILSVDALNSERCVSVGARDRTVRLWKVPEETQLVFRGSEEFSSLDLVSMIDHEHFVTGAGSGAISIWGLHKKKPLITESKAHDESISALFNYRLTDLLFSASDDGAIKAWCIDTDDYQSIQEIGQIPVIGHVNGLALDDNGAMLAAAVGRDHRLGRWQVHKQAKNRILLIELK